MSIRLYLACLLCCIIVTFGSAQVSKFDTALGPLEDEVLTYNVYIKTGFLYFSLGEVVFSTTKRDGYFNLNVAASTFPRWQRFYEFQSDFNSLLDSSASYPQIFTRHSLERGNTVFDSISFDQAALTAEEFVSNNDGELFTYDLELSEQLHDMVSFFYALRFIDYLAMAEGESKELKLLHNRREYNMNVQYVSEEEKKIKRGGKYKSHKIEINAIKGLHFDGHQTMNMWISDDHFRIPISFETPFKLGSLRIVLKED